MNTTIEFALLEKIIYNLYINMTDYSKTSARIREILPRLMELTPGCWIADQFEGENTPWMVGLYAPGGQRLIMSEEVTDHCGHMNLDHKRDDFEIIGHPIKLEDVLEAFSSVRTHYSGIYVETDGYAYSKEDDMTPLFIWKYGKTFDDQPGKTKQFISEILSNKE